MFNFLKKKKPITEKDREEIEAWYAEARKMTIKKLPKFLKKITSGYSHDYGTIVEATAAAANAAAWAVNASPEGGITGFQGSCVMWRFIQRWMGWGDEPHKIVSFDKMLYPQYEKSFEKTIDKDVWGYLQEQAKQLLDKETNACEAVKNHWKSIVSGTVPFGYVVKEED